MNATNRIKPLDASQLPQYPWQKVATDLFEFNKRLLLAIHRSGSTRADDVDSGNKSHEVHIRTSWSSRERDI